MARRAKNDKASKNTAGADFEPTAGYVLVQQLEAETVTESGIYLPDSAKDKPQSGKVLAVGPDKVSESGAKIKAPVKKGDNVIFKKWGGNEVTFGSKEFLFVKFEDILAVKK